MRSDLKACSGASINRDSAAEYGAGLRAANGIRE